jgi:hypothetical protein
MRLFDVLLMLENAVQYLSEGLAIGQEVNNGALRIHRYASSIKVTDLQNAGRRGKMVDEFALYDLDYVRDPKLLRLINAYAARLPRETSYKRALAMAKGISDESDRLKVDVSFGGRPKLQQTQKKGVRVAPAHQDEIDIVGNHIRFRTHPVEGFSIRDLKDPNEQTMMSPNRGGIKAANKKVYQWATGNRRKILGMTFKDAQTLLKDRLKVGYHYYLGMD